MGERGAEERERGGERQRVAAFALAARERASAIASPASASVSAAPSSAAAESRPRAASATASSTEAQLRDPRREQPRRRPRRRGQRRQGGHRRGLIGRAAADRRERRHAGQRGPEREQQVPAQPGERDVEIGLSPRGPRERGEAHRAGGPAEHEREPVGDRGEGDVGEHDPEPAGGQRELVRHAAAPPREQAGGDVRHGQRGQPQVQIGAAEPDGAQPRRARAR